MRFRKIRLIDFIAFIAESIIMQPFILTLLFVLTVGMRPPMGPMMGPMGPMMRGPMMGQPRKPMK